MRGVVVKKRSKPVYLLCRIVEYNKYIAKRISIYDKNPDKEDAQFIDEIPDVEAWAPFIKGLPTSFRKDKVIVGFLEFREKK